jgi:hypothetical protein
MSAQTDRNHICKITARTETIEFEGVFQLYSVDEQRYFGDTFKLTVGLGPAITGSTSSLSLQPPTQPLVQSFPSDFSTVAAHDVTPIVTPLPTAVPLISSCEDELESTANELAEMFHVDYALIRDVLRIVEGDKDRAAQQLAKILE